MILDLEIGSNKRKLKVKSVHIEDVQLENKKVTKVILECDSQEKREFHIDEALIKNHKDEIKIQGLWVTLDEYNKISHNSTLAKVLNYYKLNTLREIINQEITAYPKKNDFLVVVACDFDESEIS